VIVLELVIMIAAVEHAATSALRSIRAPTVSGQLVGHWISVRIRPALILSALPIGCAHG